MSRHLDLVTDADRQRFWGSVTKTPTCWLWNGELNNQGYGRFSLWRDNGRLRILAHRLSFWIANGGLPRLLRHTCDTPACVRPDHLLPGTQADNIADAVSRGRMNVTGLADYHARRNERVRVRIEAGIKYCSRCRTTKSLDDFHRSSTAIDGRQPNCKVCQAEMKRLRRRSA